MALSKLAIAGILAAALAGCAALRMPAKASLATGAVEEFATLHDLLRTLPPDEEMRRLRPPLTRTPARTPVEERNVAVEAWVYAVASEPDGDYHVVLGSASEPPAEFMTAEITRVPAHSADRATLLAAREQFQTIFGHHPWWGIYARCTPPVHVRVTGSLFYDIDHAPGHVGPREFASATSWEIHPVTSISVIGPAPESP